MEKFVRFNARVQEGAGALAAFLTSILVLLVVGDVVGRYIFNVGSVALQELEWHIFSIIFLLAAGYTFKRGEHVKIDVLYNRFTKKGQALVDIAGTVVLLFSFSGFVIWYSIDFIWSSYLINEGSPDPGGLPSRFLLKTMIPTGFILLLMQGVIFLLDAVKRYKNEGEEKSA